MKVRIDALDTLTFGVGKPSVWGEDTFGAGMFPPFPSVVRGAARAGWLYENGSFDMANTDADPSREYVVSEYALLLGDVPHFPVPADYVWNKEKNKLIRCELQENDGLSSLKTSHLLWADTSGKVESAEGRYLSLASLQAYLNGERIIDSVALTKYITEESKIGIYRGRATNTVRQGMLYRSPLVRPNNAALAANIEGAEPDGLIRFGGDNKAARFTAYDGVISPQGAIGDDGRFRLYIATPAMFDSGYEPELPVKAELLTAAVYGYDSIGGFDMKERRPKKMRRAVKGGSVYYYRLAVNDEENRAAILSLHGKSISKHSKEDGFGICYIGKI